jgi:hypothetical protein
MKRICAALVLVVAAAGAGAEPGCVEELYDPLSGTGKRRIASPDPSVVLRVDPERSDPLWLDDPDRAPRVSIP